MEEALGPDNTHTVKALPPTSWHLTTVFLWLARLVAVHTERAVRVGTRRVQCVACAVCAARVYTATGRACDTALVHVCAAGTGSYATPLPPLFELLGFFS